MTRVLTAVVLLPLLWLLVERAPAWAFFAIVLLVMSIAAWECYSLLETRGVRPFKTLGIVVSLLLALSFVPGALDLGPGLTLTLATLAAITGAMWRRDDPRSMLDASWATLFPVLLVGLAFGYAIGLRAVPGRDGTDLTMLLLVCVMFADTAAYYVGRSLGARRLAPVLSPAKTWEGAVGGVAASVGGALLAHFWFYQRLPLRHALILGVLLGVASILGDLAESMVKRAAGVKDSARLLPGHGGLFDRTDSLLFAAPVLYYYSMRFLDVGGS